MELQAAFAQMRQRTIAESRPTHSTQSKHQLACRPQARIPQGKPTLPCYLNLVRMQRQRLQLNKRAIGPKVSAHSLADQRPAAPPATHEPEKNTWVPESSTHSLILSANRS